MACVSKPMRMKDFPFQPADTLLQYSLLKQLHASSTAPQKNTVRFFIFHGPFSSSSPSSSSSSLPLLLLSKTPFFFFFFRCTGLAAKNSLHVFFVCVCVCYPKQKTAREWTRGGRESNTEPGNRRWWDVKKDNDMPSTQSHLGLSSRIIILEKKKEEKQS